MHVLLLVAVFASFVGMGFFVRHRYKTRKVFFENLLSFCDHLLIEISFQKNTIRKIIQTYGDSYGRHFREVLNGYQGLIDEKSDITRERMQAFLEKQKLKSHESITVADFFYELGRHGSHQESSKILAKRQTFDTFFNTAATALRRDASIYFKVLILMGVAAVILLL